MKCSFCGEEIPDSSYICPNCGTVQYTEDTDYSSSMVGVSKGGSNGSGVVAVFKVIKILFMILIPFAWVILFFLICYFLMIKNNILEVGTPIDSTGDEIRYISKKVKIEATDPYDESGILGDVSVLGVTLADKEYFPDTAEKVIKVEYVINSYSNEMTYGINSFDISTDDGDIIDRVGDFGYDGDYYLSVGEDYHGFLYLNVEDSVKRIEVSYWTNPELIWELKLK